MRRLAALIPYLALVLLPAAIIALHHQAPQPYQAAADLTLIENRIISQTESTDHLPSDMKALSLPADLEARSQATGHYTYRPISATSYELCASFPSAGGDASNHEIGPIRRFAKTTRHQCFTGESLYLISRQRVSAGQYPICNETQTDPSNIENQVKDSSLLGTIDAVTSDQLILTETGNGPGLCQYATARTASGTAVNIRDLPRGTQVRVYLNISSQVLLVQALKPTDITAALKTCFGGADQQHYAAGFFYDAWTHPALQVVSKSLDEHWITFRNSKGSELTGYWCNNMSARLTPATGAEVAIGDLETGQIIYDPDFR